MSGKQRPQRNHDWAAVVRRYQRGNGSLEELSALLADRSLPSATRETVISIMELAAALKRVARGRGRPPPSPDAT
jgi:hypothetical protein